MVESQMRWVLRRLVSAALLALSALACAQGVQVPSPDMEVLNPQGGGIPLAPYLSELVSKDPKATGSVMPRLVFPIQTEALTPGRLPGDGIAVLKPRWLAQPIFLVGMDVLSMTWLNFNKDRLLAMNATGLVVHAADADDFRLIQDMAPDLAYAPASGAWLDQQMNKAGVRVYPVLIDTQGKAWQRLGGLDTAPPAKAHGKGRP